MGSCSKYIYLLECIYISLSTSKGSAVDDRRRDSSGVSRLIASVPLKAQDNPSITTICIWLVRDDALCIAASLLQCTFTSVQGGRQQRASPFRSARYGKPVVADCKAKQTAQAHGQSLRVLTDGQALHVKVQCVCARLSSLPAFDLVPVCQHQVAKALPLPPSLHHKQASEPSERANERTSE